MSFHIIQTAAYLDGLGGFDSEKRLRVERFVSQIKEQASFIGKPLGYPFFREKKFNGNRMYFLVYEEWNAAALVGFSDKKNQAETIAEIKENLPHYRQFVFRELKRLGII